MGGACSTYVYDEKCINSYKILVEKPDWKISLQRHRRRSEDNIRMDLREVVWEGVDWHRIGTSGGCRERGNEPLGSIKCGEFLD